MKADWHLQKPDVALGKLTSADSHFTYETKADKEQLTLAAFSITHDLTGAPKFPEGKTYLGKVYTLNLPNTRDIPGGKVAIELVEDAPSDAKISRYIESDNKWEELDTKVSGSKLEANSNGGGIFSVLINSSK